MGRGSRGRGRRSAALAAGVIVAALHLGTATSPAAVGDLTYQDCISGETESSPACALIPAATSGATLSGLSLPQAVVVSPDGTSVYAAAENDDAIVRFARDPATGALTHQGCISGETSAGPPPPGDCTVLASATVGGKNSGMDRVRALAMSPDGAHLYAVALNDDAVVHFTRNVSTGELTFAGCLTGDSDVVNPCNDVGPDTIAGGNTSGFNQPFDLVVAEDSVHVVTQEDDSIITLGRASNTGSLSYGPGSCLTSEIETGPTPGSGACAALPTITTGGANSGFDKPRSVTMTADGTSVYVAAPQDDSVTEFDRAPGGALTHDECITAESESTAPCSDLPTPVGLEPFGTNTGIDNPQSIVVSPDGASLYLASGNDHSVARFDRGVAGSLTYQGCITGELEAGPDPPGNGACAGATVLTNNGANSGFQNMRDVVVAPDGASVYAGSGEDSSVIRFSRAAGGAISFVNCFSGETESGACIQIPSAVSLANNSGMAWVQALAVSPDAANLYYVSQVDHAVGRFALELPPPAPESPTQGGDTSAPDTAITDGPKKKTRKKRAEFDFSGTDARVVAGFQCSLDGANFVPCTSPFTTKVKKGKHEFRARAVDAAGNIDPTPASYGWKVKRKKKRTKK